MARASTRTKRSGGKREAEPERRGYCALPEIAPRPLAEGMPFGRARLIRINEKKWVNRTVLRYAFLDEPAHWRGSPDDKDAVREAFRTWKEIPIGLEFREVGSPEEAEIRIGFDRRDGSWSYVGRDAVDHVPDPAERTMNFGWPLTTPYGRDTALHEIGHALGFPHEHQNPNAGIVWDEAAVHAYFSGSPNFWSPEQIRWNILRQLSPAEVEGTSWDPDSIMHYRFDAGLILDPPRYREEPLVPEPGLSEADRAAAQRFYPPVEDPRLPELRPFEAHRITVGSGGQMDFSLKPDFSRDYTISTLGSLDTVLVLFEEIDGEPAYLDGDDDSGWNRNATITRRLVRGRSYVVRLRVYYARILGQGAVVMF